MVKNQTGHGGGAAGTLPSDPTSRNLRSHKINKLRMERWLETIVSGEPILSPHGNERMDHGLQENLERVSDESLEKTS
jgi:hypothetical protein